MEHKDNRGSVKEEHDVSFLSYCVEISSSPSSLSVTNDTN